MVTVATDASLLRGAALAELAATRGEQAETGGGKGYS
jgi:hypothetical protein